MSILLSTNMYSAKTFPRIQRYLDYFQGAVGVEVFPLFHDRDFEAELNRLLPELEKVPVTFHEPYYQADHTAPEGSDVCERTDEMFQKTVRAAEKLKARHIVFHHNNCRVPDDPSLRAQMLERSCRQYRKAEEMAMQAGIPVLVENVGVHSRGNVLLDEEAFIRLCKEEKYPVLIDIGHAHANGWDIGHVCRELSGQIHAYHLHNNDGIHDSHRRIHDGTLDFDAFLRTVRDIGRPVDLVVEYAAQVEPDEAGIRADLEELLEWTG